MLLPRSATGVSESAAGTLLTNRYVLFFAVRPAIGSHCLPRVTVHSDKLPEDVLLEIFDAYRRLYKLEFNYENVWNSRNGWFKLAHVCQSWRRVVLLSPSRLHVHLLFTPRRSSSEPMLKCLPSFPILVDYSAASWTEKEQNLALEALTGMHRGRVRTIALRWFDTDMAEILKALGHPFPELESLEICHGPMYQRPMYEFDYDYEGELILPTTLLSGSAPCLRQLTLRGVVPDCLSPLLSFTTGLVELALTLNTLPPEASLLPNLQRMSCLRRLELYLKYRPFTMAEDPPTYAGDIVSLSHLTHLIFTGHRSYLQELVVGLAAPSLQYLDVELRSHSTHGSFPIPHLCKFLCDTEYQFTAVRLEFSNSKLKFHAGKVSQPVDDEPFGIIICEPVSLEQMGRELSGPLSSVETLVITWSVDWRTEGGFQTDQWRGFCNHVSQVKVVRVAATLALEVAHSFKQDGPEAVLGFLPFLQRVEVPLRVSDEDLRVSICDAFKPFIAARQRVGRPIALLFI
jgi:hypothetical protein